MCEKGTLHAKYWMKALLEMVGGTKKAMMVGDWWAVCRIAEREEVGVTLLTTRHTMKDNPILYPCG